MNPNDNIRPSLPRLRSLLRDTRQEDRFRLAVLAGAFTLTLAAFVLLGGTSRSSKLAGFEAGKVAERDVIAELDLVYVDAVATALRIEAEKRLVPAVFVVDDATSKAIVDEFELFRQAFLGYVAQNTGKEILLRKLAVDFPRLAQTEVPQRLADYPIPGNAFAQAAAVIKQVLGSGIAAMPAEGLERYNPEIVELRRWSSGPLMSEQLPIEKLISSRGIDAAALAAARKLGLTPNLTGLAADLAAVFLRENAYFDAALSARRLESAAAAVEPVMRRIGRGDRVVRRGFIVTSEDMEKLSALKKTGAGFDIVYLFGGALLLCALFAGSYLLLKREGMGPGFARSSFLLVVTLACGYFILAALVNALYPESRNGMMAGFLPTALLSILIAILFYERFAIILTVSLSFGLLIASGLDGVSFALALSSGLGGVLLVRKAEKRIDLVRAGSQLALLLFVIGFALSAMTRALWPEALGVALLSALNGFFCAVLALGFLPVIEQALNAPTLFRLQELSDLNAPALKRLLSVAPGTYSHSITVAHLAESACREINADALLARVGAYYHDIGKTEQPEYFIENQSGYNKHDEINPRLSATVLRSHVKFGLERAEALRLPESVKAIIAEHHGSSVMGYFYAQALKDAADTKAEEYSYPGPEPSSKEAAVVMLADCVEAASRTLKRPSMSKLEQFVRDMVMDKFEQRQLVKSALSFHDLELIINTFVRILAGHFHSRIEYPKLREGQR
ncbi:MAG TPA: phosphohydrolase [Spirochaetaceae bacterium]|nr:phosphohydrolase [Spirochaetaceae bacterium]